MNASEQIVVVARWETTEQMLDEVIRLVAELRRHSIAEPGCTGYEIFLSDDRRSILLLEDYRDAAAQEAHKSSTHYQELVVDRILPMLTQRRVELLRPRE